jgi:hypothetical protein
VHQTTVAIGDMHFALAQNSDVEHLKAAALEAVRNGSGFVDFTVVGNRLVSVLLPVGTIVVFSSGEIAEDERDTGNLRHPYDDGDDL